MKKLFFLLLIVASLVATAQSPSPISKSARIEPYGLEVTINKTTNLVFPAPIMNIDRGSAAIIVQKATGTENILRVKADTAHFQETNLTVLTTEGKLYSFLVSYTDRPSYLNINVKDMNNGLQDNIVVEPISTKPKVIYTEPKMDEGNLKFYSDKAKEAKKNIRHTNDENSNVSVAINGIYIKGNSLFFKLQLDNTTNIDFDIEQFRWYIHDSKQGKRTASQETEIEPMFIVGDIACIKGQTTIEWVVVLPKFTIPDGKYVAVDIMEKNGGRHLHLKIKNSKIIKARTL